MRVSMQNQNAQGKERNNDRHQVWNAHNEQKGTAATEGKVLRTYRVQYT